GPVAFGGMSGFNRAHTSSVYLVVLSKDDPSPLLPESDDEKGTKPTDKEADKEKAKEKKDLPKVRVDLENIDQRVLALPLPNRNYTGLLAGKAGTLFLIEGEPVNMPRRGPPPGSTVQKFDLAKRKAEKFLDGAASVVVSPT